MAAVLAALPPGVKPVPMQNLHLTLRFLGQSSEAQAWQLWDRLSAASLPAFSVRLDELLCWPGPRVLCLAGAMTDPGLQRLDALITQAAASAGYPPAQHPLHPHLTLARGARQLPSTPVTVPVLQVQPTELHLYQSVSTPAGVRYPVLASLPLVAGSI
jgi:2'-5' RNA ligase